MKMSVKSFVNRKFVDLWELRKSLFVLLSIITIRNVPSHLLVIYQFYSRISDASSASSSSFSDRINFCPFLPFSLPPYPICLLMICVHVCGSKNKISSFNQVLLVF